MNVPRPQTFALYIVYHTHIFRSNFSVAFSLRHLLRCFIRRVPLCSVANPLSTLKLLKPINE